MFKDLDEMNDREMFTEYDKMLKQSTKVRRQYHDRIAAVKQRLEDEKDQEFKNKHKYSINGKEEEEELDSNGKSTILDNDKSQVFNVNDSK